MTIDLDPSLVARYTSVAELSQRPVAPHRPRRRGRRAALSARDVVTVMICEQGHGRSERGFVRCARQYWRGYFPGLLDQSAFTRRGRDLPGTLTPLVPLGADELGATMASAQGMDGVGMPLARRSRGLHHRRCGDEAGIGRGGTDKDGVFGGPVVLSCAPTGAITGGVVGPAATEERGLAEAWACWRTDPNARPWDGQHHRLPPSHQRGGRQRGPTGPSWPRDGAGPATPAPTLADRGDRGRPWQAPGRDADGTVILTTDTYPGDQAPAARRQHPGRRQIVETVNGIREQTCHRHVPTAHSLWGLRARLAAKPLAFNRGLRLNTRFGRDLLACSLLAPC